MNGLFRKAALERLSSPEQLDKAIVVSTPVSWLALIGVTVIVAASVLWLVYGGLPITIMAAGQDVNQ
jgi:HlyD family secretion protein